MAEGDNKQAVLIRKRRKGHGGHAHHGGAWKVAYADFVTAMMAFFLLLWLLSAATDEQKQGIADYFSPVSVARNTASGSGGLLGGETITADGAMVSDRTPFGITMTLPADDFKENETTDEPSEGRERPTARELAELEERALDDEGRKTEQRSDDRTKDAEISEGERAQRQAEQRFEQAVEQLRTAVQSVPELSELADNLLVDHTPEGMRLQIVDQDGTSMFDRGSAALKERTKQLFALVSTTLAKLPNRVAIKGHTDAVPYRGDGGYTNWELSSDRALASRRALVDAGLDPSRVADVVGKADTDPLIQDDPNAAQNRRISIILLNEPVIAAAPRDLGTAPQAPDETGVPPGSGPGQERNGPDKGPAGAPAATPSIDARAAAPAMPTGDGRGIGRAPAADSPTHARAADLAKR